jgi:hypothetical protein
LCECAALTTVPPSGFDYPLGGLLPSVPGRFCFTPPALLGFHPSESHLPSDRSDVSIRPFPRTVSPAVVPGVTVGSARQAAVSGLCLRRKFLSTAVGLARPPQVTPLGFVPSRVLGEDLVRDSARTPLARFAGRFRIGLAKRRLRVSIGLRFARPWQFRLAAGGDPQRIRGYCGRATLIGFSHRLGPGIQAHIHPGYVFTSRPGMCCHIPQTFFG